MRAHIATSFLTLIIEQIWILTGKLDQFEIFVYLLPIELSFFFNAQGKATFSKLLSGEKCNLKDCINVPLISRNRNNVAVIQKEFIPKRGLQNRL